MSFTFVRRVAVAALALPLLLGGCADDEPVPKLPDTSSPTSPVTETSEPQPWNTSPTRPPSSSRRARDRQAELRRSVAAQLRAGQLRTGDRGHTGSSGVLGLPILPTSCEAAASASSRRAINAAAPTLADRVHRAIAAEVTWLGERSTNRVSGYYCGRRSPSAAKAGRFGRCRPMTAPTSKGKPSCAVRIGSGRCRSWRNGPRNEAVASIVHLRQSSWQFITP